MNTHGIKPKDIMQAMEIEHDLIDRMLTLLKKEEDVISEKDLLNREFIDLVIEFFRDFVQEVHHAKRVKINEKLMEKDLSLEDRGALKDFISKQGHIRKIVDLLEEARKKLELHDGKIVDKAHREIAELIMQYSEQMMTARRMYPALIKEYLDESERAELVRQIMQTEKIKDWGKFEETIRRLEKARGVRPRGGER
ncbi:MAG: hypothetical protein GF409_07620 [Candidatus Omnitrophica bacterium]|nr:hypothetical protein [Candidatus Omnitrophota bacterium]